jgi:general secretion pathway protein C
MKPPFKPQKLKWIAIPLITIMAIKLVWIIVEMAFLPATGISQEEEIRGKPLYYRVSLSSDRVAPPKKKVKRLPVASIKDITLLAVYSAEDTTVVTVMHKHHTSVLSRGESINGFTLEGAGSNYATFSKNGKHYRIDLTEEKKGAGSGTIQVLPHSSSSKSKVSTEERGEIIDAGDHKIIERSLFEHFAKNMDDVYKDIGIGESRKNGKVQFKITFVKRGTPFAKLGIRRGDILKSVNGQEIDSYNTAFNIYKNIGDTENLTLVILRGKEEMELNYEIN